MSKLRFKDAPDIDMETQSGALSIVSNNTPVERTPEGDAAKRKKLESIITCNFAMCREISGSKTIAKDEGLNKIIKFYAHIKTLAVKNEIDFDDLNQKLIIKHCVSLSNVIQDAQINVLNQAISITWGFPLTIDRKGFCELVKEISLDENGIEAQQLSLLPDAVKAVYANIIQERRVRYGSI